MSILRIRPRGSLTYHRAVLTPRATIAAKFQSSGQLRPRATPGGDATKHAFIEELEAKIALALQQNLSAVETFRVYQGAFSTIIERFENHADTMRTVKEGYESVIDSLFEHNRRAISLQKQVGHAVSNMELQVFDTQEKIESKKRGFLDLIDSCRRLISDLREDITQQEQELREGRVAFQITENLSAQNGIILSALEKKMTKMEGKRADWAQTCEDLRGLREAKIQYEVEYRDDLERVLNQICQRSRAVRELKASLATLRPRVDAAKERLASRRQLLEQEQPKTTELRENIQSQYKRIDTTLKENEEIGTILRVELGNIRVEDRLIGMYYEDLVRLVALYISRMNGYRDGIDPSRFPDLA
jgi:predicted  nucleic acid-binding Zn-ribbon protein